MRRKKGFFILILTILLSVCAGCDLKEATADLSGLLPMGSETEPDAVEETMVAENYHYTRLSEDAKLAYRQIVSGIDSRARKFEVSASGVEALHTIYGAVLADYPEYFWLDGDSTVWDNHLGSRFELEPVYSVPADQISGIQQQIDAAVQQFLDTIPAEADVYTKIKLTYEYVILNTDYSETSTQNQNIQSVFLNHSSVCAGYAKSFQYLMKKMGIPCIYVAGSVAPDATPHAWNMVGMNGQYYEIDATWGDPNYLNTDEQAQMSILYDYFCVTSEELSRTHTVTDEYTYPDCTDPGYNFYARFSHYYDTYEEAQVLQAVRDTIDNGETRTFLKFSNPDAYQQAKAAIQNGELLKDAAQDIMRQKGLDEYRYYFDFNEAMYILKIYW